MSKPSSNRTRKSTVWNHFDKLLSSSQAQCNRCGRNLSFRGGSTSSLHNHLRQVHGITSSVNLTETETESSDSVSAVAIKKPRLQQSSIYNFVKEENSIDVILAKLIAIDGFSMNAVVHSEFIQTAFCERGLTLPKHPSTVTRILNDHADKLKEQLAEEFRVMIENGRRFSFMLDEWTSCRQRRYMSVTCNDGQKLHRLGMIPLHGRWTADNITSFSTKN